eukprot:6455941-Alexandrium_andersonii.AAC.1
MRSASAWNCSRSAAWTVSMLASSSVMTKQRLWASASSAVARARPARSCEAIGASPIGGNQAAASCS